MYFVKAVAPVLLALVPVCIASSLPVVDLGYELHQAISLNETQGLYNFSNIRYAAPPLADLRFRAPIPPKPNRTTIQTGATGRICPQSNPIWESEILPEFLVSVVTGIPFNQSANISEYGYTPAKPDPRTTEDCLFLDVIVPKKVFDSARNRTAASVPGAKKRLAPVLVWIYGGGYVAGDKSLYDSTGLVQRSMKGGKDGIVYVALNYRLGAFGWLAGSGVTANGTANAALYDQRFALDWVYKYIHLFGGNPENVTVMGESAGGGSILHQITAFGGNRGPVPFKQAILQSPGWYPLPSQAQTESTLRQFLKLLNVTSVEEARKLPTELLVAANAYQVGVTPTYGTYTYGPAVDGTFVPDMPGKLLLNGSFDKNLNVMVGHNGNEGLIFTSPASINGNAYTTLLTADLPTMPQNVTNYVANVLYPPVYNGSYGYTNPFERLSLTTSDVVFQCNTDYLNRAFKGQTHAYMFSIPPAIHAQDVPYTFFSGNHSTVANATVALAMQDWFTSFVQTGTPRSTLSPVFERSGKNGTLLNVGLSNITVIRDPTANPRCRFWQNAPYYRS
ncbi:hypothetical protein ASPWEDRAFT_22285 [Aspergillus wentii DTO 134E9]|uniref:Carboxylic ester hydrolase n=1 Tax=Aspergillus wentii DTO 134E9 TaxID=1073089 RepID=A0A1L9RYN1_ASPWE|nr:uncharacterized protein ASPWEDRAFT_22285 [Aspergillus wentii DTO 134E9]KAI9932510.1 hypothetical protein MW887_008752 [Aspergillus wentii]OJJ40076.1 hypothetical protein ASPWEDRAFT_22285 [Aspergillus wentii DTO 134E9]